MSGIINIATKAAYQAGNIIQQASRNLSKLSIEKKTGKNNFITELDRRAKQIIVDTIKKAFPQHNILAEGICEINKDSDCTWIIDPISGTTNYTHTNPQYAVSIAFKQIDRITHGIVFDPNRNDLYKAELGKGAYLNDSRIRVNNISYLEDALLATGFPTNNFNLLDQYLAILKDMLLHTAGQCKTGSAALDLAYVAAGYLDGFWEFGLNPCNIAAGYILVKESGGLITDFYGTQELWISGNVVAGSPKLLPEILKVIQKHL